MAVCYNNLWKLLIDKNMNKTELKEAAGISFNVMARMGKNETISFEMFFEFPAPHKYKPVLRDVLLDCPKSEGASYSEYKRKIFELVIVFTSNISKEDFKKKISPELRSRFDYKGMFNLLTEEDKLKFVHFRVNQIVDKYKEFVSTDLPERIHGEVVGAIDVTQFKNMRDLNKKIKDTFVERIKVSV